jgi:hypothetical protein
MNFKRSSSFLLFLLILLSHILIFSPVSAVTYLEDFEDDTLTQQASESIGGQVWLNTWTAGSNSYVDNSQAVSGSKSYRSYRQEATYTNFTYSEDYFIKDYSMLFYTGHGTTYTKNWSFLNESGEVIFEFKVDNDGASWNTWHWKDYNGWNENNEVLAFSVWYWFNITIDNNDSYDFTLTRYSNGAVLSNHQNQSPVIIVPDLVPRITTFYYRGNQNNQECDLWADDIRPTFSEISSVNLTYLRSIYINFRDLETGQLLSMMGQGYSTVMYAWEFRATMESDILPVGYKYSEYWGAPLEIEAEFDNGQTVTIWFRNITGINGDFENQNYFDYEFTSELWNNQIYTIYLGEIDIYAGFDNEKIRSLRGGLSVHLATDKKYYGPGEEVRIRYKLPTQTELHNEGYLSGGWEIWAYDADFRYLYIWETDGGNSAVYNYDSGLVYDNQYHILTHDFPQPTDGLDHYKLYIGQPGLWLDNFLIQNPVHFYISVDNYTSFGNITSISPANPEIGQEVTITFNASNYGQLDYRRYGDSEYTLITAFAKLSGNQQAPYQFWELGRYRIRLLVAGLGEDFQEKDTLDFWVNDTNGTYGGYGYNIEYLEVYPERAVAGNDTVKISYKTLVNNTRIDIIDARGQRTGYGTTVQDGTGIHTFYLPQRAPIGTWNITLYANETLYTEFSVIADAFNFVEFQRNIYYTYNYKNQAFGEFEIYLRHDRPVYLIFKKDGVPQGANMFFDTGVNPDGTLTIPKEQIPISVGSWTVELWESHNRIKKRLLALDNCSVYEGVTTKEDVNTPGYGNIFQMLAVGAQLFGGGSYGLAFMAIFMIIVFVVILEGIINKDSKGKNKSDHDITLLIAISMMLFFAWIGWLPIWLVLICIILAGLTFSDWFSKKMGLKGA